jgi:hypothetical protein
LLPSWQSPNHDIGPGESARRNGPFERSHRDIQARCHLAFPEELFLGNKGFFHNRSLLQFMPKPSMLRQGSFMSYQDDICRDTVLILAPTPGKVNSSSLCSCHSDSPCEFPDSQFCVELSSPLPRLTGEPNSLSILRPDYRCEFLYTNTSLESREGVEE